jgi:hypothetical protein
VRFDWTRYADRSADDRSEVEAELLVLARLADRGDEPALAEEALDLDAERVALLVADRRIGGELRVQRHLRQVSRGAARDRQVERILRQAVGLREVEAEIDRAVERFEETCLERRDAHDVEQIDDHRIGRVANRQARGGRRLDRPDETASGGELHLVSGGADQADDAIPFDAHRPHAVNLGGELSAIEATHFAREVIAVGQLEVIDLPWSARASAAAPRQAHRVATTINFTERRVV